MSKYQFKDRVGHFAEKKLVTALWWANYVMVTLFKNDLKCICGIVVLQSVVTISIGFPLANMYNATNV